VRAIPESTAVKDFVSGVVSFSVLFSLSLKPSHFELIKLFREPMYFDHFIGVIVASFDPLGERIVYLTKSLVNEGRKVGSRLYICSVYTRVITSNRTIYSLAIVKLVINLIEGLS
jgi:hypothetical protein